MTRISTAASPSRTREDRIDVVDEALQMAEWPSFDPHLVAEHRLQPTRQARLVISRDGEGRDMRLAAAQRLVGACRPT